MPSQKPHPEDKQALSLRVAAAVLSWPRLTRILLALVLALVVTLAVSPVVDDIYLRFFYSESTRILPSLVTACFGLMMYFAGWFLIVGTVREENPLKSVVIVYLAIGALALIVAAIWLLRLVILGNTPF